MMSLANGACSRQTVIVLMMVISSKPRIAFSLNVFEKTNKVSGDMSHLTSMDKRKENPKFWQKTIYYYFCQNFYAFQGVTSQK